ncbi:hypothetical protein WDU94_001409 [Cyamophila willieti]
MWSHRTQVFWKIHAISVLVVILSIVQRNDAHPEFQAYGDKKLGEITNAANLCPSGCEKITINQAKPVCGGNITVPKPNIYFKVDIETVHFTSITSAKCNGATCHVEIGTDQVDAWHAGMDCTQKGTDAACACTIYMKTDSN